MARKNMLTSEQENIIKKYVNSRTYDIKKLIQYLTIHDEVGSDIFSYITLENERMHSRRIRRTLSFRYEYSFPVVSVDTFIRRIPLYFYEGEDKKDFFDLVELINAFEVEYMRENTQDRILQLDYETLYAKLEELFYDYNIPASDIFNYYIHQTGNCRRFDIFEKWLHYLELAKQFEINDYTPNNILYSYNLALERAGLEPILYEVGPYVGFNEYFIRSGKEILMGGELPVDNDGNIVRRWLLVNIENEKYINTYVDQEKPLLVEIHIGLDINTKIYIANIYNSENDDDVWYPIYFGPRVMSFNSETLKYYRNRLDLTQQELADAVGVKLRTYQKWEKGDTIPDGYNLIRLMNYLDIDSVQEFVDNSPFIDDDYVAFSSRKSYN